jgi:hypothetical protein
LPTNVLAASSGFPYNLRFPGQYYMAEMGLNQNVNREYAHRTAVLPLFTFRDRSSALFISAGYIYTPQRLLEDGYSPAFFPRSSAF